MHEVAEAPSCALSVGQIQTCYTVPPLTELSPPHKSHALPSLPHFILAAAGFPEVGYWGQFCMDRLPIKPAVIQVDHSFLRILLTSKLKRQKQSVCHSTAVLLRADSLAHY